MDLHLPPCPIAWGRCSERHLRLLRIIIEITISLKTIAMYMTHHAKPSRASFRRSPNSSVFPSLLAQLDSPLLGVPEDKEREERAFEAKEKGREKGNLLVRAAI